MARGPGGQCERIRQLVDTIASEIPGKPSIALTGHSGGGSFITGYINSADAIDARITRIAYLDANYSYDDEQHHGDKLLAWLKGDPKRHLIVIAYDDRNITLNGKPVVSATGGTWRASHRMIDRFSKDVDMPRAFMARAHRVFRGISSTRITQWTARSTSCCTATRTTRFSTPFWWAP